MIDDDDDDGSGGGKLFPIDDARNIDSHRERQTTDGRRKAADRSVRPTSSPPLPLSSPPTTNPTTLNDDHEIPLTCFPMNDRKLSKQHSRPSLERSMQDRQEYP